MHNQFFDKHILAASLLNSNLSEVLLVGGAVRDLLLGVPLKEMDFVVCSKSQELMAEVKKIEDHFKQITPQDFNITVTDRLKDFRTFKLNFEHSEPDKSFDFDFVFSRHEIYADTASKPRVLAGSLNEDLARRDFSINALATKDLAGDSLEIVDYFNGKEDLDSRTLRVLHLESFRDDPLRMVRGVRFKERLEFNFEKQTLALLEESINLRYLLEATLGRRYFEFKKIFLEQRARFVLIELLKLGIFDQLLGITCNYDRDEFLEGLLSMAAVTELDVLRQLFKSMSVNEAERLLKALPLSNSVKRGLI